MVGRLEVICGPMYSGKSEELIRRLRRESIAGRKVLVVKPLMDDRYDSHNVVSHTGSTIQAIPLIEITHLDNLSKSYEVIGIDEAQFFDAGDLLKTVKLLVEDDGRKVILAGLDMTFRRQPFGVIPYLMATSDLTDKLNAVCHSCGNDAIYTQRLTDGKPASFQEATVSVGGLDSYEARCRECFQEG